MNDNTNREALDIFRLENPDTMAGMWYRIDGTFDPFIFKLTEGVSRDLPMEPHERYGQFGRRWFSGCVDSASLNAWFSTNDARELCENGYKLYKFKATEYQIEEHQVIFTREGLVGQDEIPLSTIFNLTNN